MRAGETVKIRVGDYSCSNFSWLRQFSSRGVGPGNDHIGCHPMVTVALDLFGGRDGVTGGIPGSL